MADFARSTHPAVQSQLDRLAKLSPGFDVLGLERITILLDRLGRPQDAAPAGASRRRNQRQGLDLRLPPRRDRGGGPQLPRLHQPASGPVQRTHPHRRHADRDDLLAALLTEVLDASEGIEASFFEVTTAVAFLAFARTPADACIVEVGLGGRLDATNVIERPLVCGIASLGLDHQQFLGSDIVAIAKEKAGIARPGVPLVSLSQPAEAEAAIIEAASGLRRTGSCWKAAIGHSTRP